MKKRFLILVVPVAVLILLDIFLKSFSHASLDHMLEVRLNRQNVFAMGNSMFKTGIDFELLNSIIPPTEHVDFEYHNGYYSNLWYLIVKKAIIPSRERPKMIIWGFRPSYAILPAFRQNKVGFIEKLKTGEDRYYEAKTFQIKKSVNNTFHAWLQNNSFLYGSRDTIRASVTRFLNQVSIKLLKPLLPKKALEKLRHDLLVRNLSVSDYLVRRLSYGRYKTVEERTVDAGKRFIKGEKVEFSESFIPDIASMISEAGIPQLVLIFRPVSHVKGTMAPDMLKFTEDADRFFKEHSIPFVNFLDDERIELKHYAKGDHYNQEGRRLLTMIIGERLNQLLEEL